jgi:hypothetical protein
MKYAGPHLIRAVAIAVIGGLVLFLSSATWLEVTGASVLLIGATLVVGQIATPEFLERDLGED